MREREAREGAREGARESTEDAFRVLLKEIQQLRNELSAKGLVAPVGKETAHKEALKAKPLPKSDRVIKSPGLTKNKKRSGPEQFLELVKGKPGKEKLGKKENGIPETRFG